MFISKYICIFIFYSFIGWMWDCFFDSCMHKKLQNRGFLYGPICPIYGIGVIFGFFLYYCMEKYDIYIEMWKIFIISVLISAILEYITSHLLEEIFHATWWDYSELPFNFQGRISLFTSLGFGLSGIIIIHELVPNTLYLCKNIPSIAFEITSYILIFLVAIDFTLTIITLYQFDKFIISLNKDINEHFEDLFQGVHNKHLLVKNSVHSNRLAIIEKIQSMDKFSKNALRGITKISYRKLLNKSNNKK